jgi:hypothetical protein
MTLPSLYAGLVIWAQEGWVNHDVGRTAAIVGKHGEFVHAWCHCPHVVTANRQTDVFRKSARDIDMCIGMHIPTTRNNSKTEWKVD